MSGIRLFQIGDLALPFWKQNLIDEYESTKRGDLVTPLRSINQISNSVRYLHKEKSIKFAGHLIGSSSFPARHYETILRSYVGTTLPVIAYENLNNDFNDISDCCASHEPCDCNFRWLIGYGEIDNVTVREDNDLNRPMILNFNLTMLTFWDSFNPYFWQWGSNASEVNNEIPISLVTDYYIPTCYQLYNKCNKYCSGYKQLIIDDKSYILNDAYFNLIPDNCSCCNYKVGQYAVDLKTFNLIPYESTGKEYNAPPRTTVLIKGFNDTNDITFNSLNNNTTNKTIIDVSATNTILVDNGYTALGINDEIALGDFQYFTGTRLLRNSAIIKNGTIIDLQPVVTYPDIFPCMIIPSNGSSFSVIGNYTTFSYQLIYRKI